jgi:cation diffusion facilitator family transporter
LKVTNNIQKGISIAKIAFIASLIIGIIETLTGVFTSSIALAADGIHSIGTAIVFLIAWIGSRLSMRAPDGKFHFGYYRFEALGSLVAAFILAIFGGIIAYESYLQWIEPRPLVNPEIAIIVVLTSATIAALLTLAINKTVKEFRSASLKTGALNGAIDVASSMAVFVSIVLSGYFGIAHADSIAGIIIALAIFPAAYSIIKESSLVLVDACSCGDVVRAITQVAKSVKSVEQVHSIRMRQLGPYIVGDMYVVVSGDTSVRKADAIAIEVEEKVKQELGEIRDLKIIIESAETYDKRLQSDDSTYR